MDISVPEVSRELARLMLMMRRMIKEEFAVSIQLSDPAAADELLAFAERSRNTLLRQMARELEGHHRTSGAKPLRGEPARYRGAAVRVQGAAEKQSKPATATRRVYRGQVIT
jgi:hypothetical protein